MIESSKSSMLYRAFAILAFAGSGILSTILFYRITDLSLLHGLSDYLLRLVLALAWVVIFPVWLLFFALFMILVDVMTSRD